MTHETAFPQDLQTHSQPQHQSAELERANEVHPFWGTPPDLATCRHWMRSVHIRLRDVKRDLRVARHGGPFRDDSGYPLPPDDYPRWLEAKTFKRDRVAHRYRWLREWARDETWRLRHTTPRPERVSVDAMHAAARRFALLEALHVALVRWLEVDSGESSDQESDLAWQALLDAVDAL